MNGANPDAYSSCMPQGQASSAIPTHNRRSALVRRWTLSIVATGLLAGCLPEPKVGFDSPAPSKRLDAIVQAAELEDDDSLVRLVEKLRSHAPAERMFAIRSLETRTGETLGYNHADSHWKRIEAYNRWLEWLTTGGFALPETMTPVETPETDQEPAETTSPDGPGDEQPMDMEQQEG
jgi:hypothetical protein